jgi:CubicO group peptidase (beta-lactamase class C family)
MYSALVEVDPSGHYVGSSYSWATGRDWGKFGLLYLHQGNWNGDQVFSPDWVRFVTTPTPTSNGHYGGHFWLNAGGFFPDVPRNMYYCSGFQGQMVAVFPTADLVVVRLGLVENPKFDGNRFFKQILDAVHPK